MKALFKRLNVEPKALELYERALTHSSYAYENQTKNNERLEFLGDSVLGVLMADFLFHHYLKNEGEMSKQKAKAVSASALALYASYIELESFMRLGKGEISKGPNQAMLADAFEALLGAIYLDLGFEAVKGVFDHIIVPHLNESFSITDYKSTLQEFIHSGEKRNISYHVIEESGPSHQKHFKVVVKLDKTIILGEGEGSTKKEAEQQAAKEALKKGNYDFKETIS
jgi:ribonuclease III